MGLRAEEVGLRAADEDDGRRVEVDSEARWELEGEARPSSMSGAAREGSVVSMPFARPAREPAPGTLSMGAFRRFS